jgi:hypothetical protein
MRQFGYLQTIYKSFYSRELYRDVAYNWNGAIFLYLLILLFLTWSITMFTVQPVINSVSQKMSDKIVPQIPVITIKDGIASTPQNKPYLITDPENKELIAIVDTSGKYKQLDDSKASMMMTKTELMFKDHQNSIRIQKIPTTVNVVIKPDVVKQKLIHFVGFSWVVLLPFLILGSYFYRLIQGLIFAVIGMIFAALMGIRVKYSTVYKLTIVALTPAIVLSTIFNLFGIYFYLQMLSYFVISMAYLIFAIGSNKKG